MAAKFDLVVAAKTVGAASIKRLGNSMQGVQGRVKNLRMAMSGLNKTFATLGLILSAGAFVRMVKGSIDAADAFGKLEIQTGIAANTLQAYVNAGKLAGVSQETIEKGLRRLAQSMREADQGVATYKDAFDDLGISVKNTDGTLKTNQQVLGEISDKFAQMEDGVTKSAIAMEIFGRSGSQMVNLLNEGKVSLEQFNFEVSERFAQNAEYFNDQLTMLGFKATGFSRQLADGLLPTLNNLAEMFSGITIEGDNLKDLLFVLNGGLKILAATAFTAYKGFEILGFSLMQQLKALNALRKGDFKGAFEEIKKFYSESAEDFGKSMKTFDEIFNGSAEASEKYGKKTGNMLNRTFGEATLAKIQTFKDSIQGVGDAFGDVVVKGIKGMEDALVKFVMTGTLNFRNLANSIISDMVRIAIQQTITRPFTNFISNIFENADGNAFVDGKVQKYAYGGVVNRPTLFPMANGMGLMGEAGAEAILPLRRGSNGKLGVQASGGGVGNIVVNVDASGSSVEGNENEGRALGLALSSAIEAELIKQKRPGGLLA
tara:strand:- start:282 stop:1913 length:1632 start_codon:yes stop_codon:yes gene_type:complete